MVSVKKISNCLSNRIGDSIAGLKNKGLDKTMAYKQKIFSERHRLGVISQDFRDFLCGQCNLRQSYFNKKIKMHL